MSTAKTTLIKRLDQQLIECEQQAGKYSAMAAALAEERERLAELVYDNDPAHMIAELRGTQSLIYDRYKQRKKDVDAAYDKLYQELCTTQENIAQLISERNELRRRSH